MFSKMVGYKNSPYESNEQRGVGNSSDLANTLRSLREEIMSWKVDNEKIIQAQEKQVEVNAILLLMFVKIEVTRETLNQPWTGGNN